MRNSRHDCRERGQGERAYDSLHGDGVERLYFFLVRPVGLNQMEGQAEGGVCV